MEITELDHYTEGTYFKDVEGIEDGWREDLLAISFEENNYSPEIHFNFRNGDVIKIGVSTMLMYHLSNVKYDIRSNNS